RRMHSLESLHDDTGVVEVLQAPWAQDYRSRTKAKARLQLGSLLLARRRQGFEIHAPVNDHRLQRGRTKLPKSVHEISRIRHSYRRPVERQPNEQPVLQARAVNVRAPCGGYEWPCSGERGKGGEGHPMGVDHVR